MNPGPNEATDTPGLPGWVWLGVGAVLVAVAGLAFLALQPPAARTDRDTKKGTVEEKPDPARDARQLLAQSRDIDSCKKAIVLANQTETSGGLGKAAQPDGLSQVDLEYVLSGSFPPADAWYWSEMAFLRAVVQGNDLAPPSGRQLSLGHLVDLWDFSMRSVRLSDLAVEEPENRGIAPLYQVLRRGTGTAEERGLVFLELMNQLGGSGDMAAPTGCLVKTQRSAGDPFHLMVAFQPESSGSVYFGDPRTGRLLGKGWSPQTLEELLKDGAWLAPFGAKGETLGDLKLSLNGATFLVPFPLASLAERQKKAQAQLFPANDSPLLFREPAPVLSRLRQALSKAGLAEPKVVVDPVYLGRLLRFLPKAEGGRDSGISKQGTELSMIPWDALPAELVPQVVQSVAGIVLNSQQGAGLAGTDLENIARLLQADSPGRPEKLGALVPEAINVRMTLAIFGGVFLDWQTAYNKGRDLLVKGDFNRIVPDLIQEKEDLERKVAAISPKSREDLVAWARDAGKGISKSPDEPGETPDDRLVRQASPLLVYLADRVAQTRLPQVQLALAQARHEQAAMAERKSRGSKQSQQAQDRQRHWKAAALAWGALAKDMQGKRLGAYARLWQGIALHHAGDLDGSRQAWAAAGEGNLPEQVTAMWLAASSGS